MIMYERVTTTICDLCGQGHKKRLQQQQGYLRVWESLREKHDLWRKWAPRLGETQATRLRVNNNNLY